MMAVDAISLDSLKAVNVATEAAFDVFKNGGSEKEATKASSDAIRLFFSSRNDRPRKGEEYTRDRKLIVQATSLAKLACGNIDHDCRNVSGSASRTVPKHLLLTRSLESLETMDSEDDNQSIAQGASGGYCEVFSIFTEIGRDLKSWNNDERLIEYLPGTLSQSMSNLEGRHLKQRGRSPGTTSKTVSKAQSTLYTEGSEDASLQTRSFSTVGDNSVFTSASANIISPSMSKTKERNVPSRPSCLNEKDKMVSVDLAGFSKDTWEMDPELKSKSTLQEEETEVLVVASGKCIEATIHQDEWLVKPTISRRTNDDIESDYLSFRRNFLMSPASNCGRNNSTDHSLSPERDKYAIVATHTKSLDEDATETAPSSQVGTIKSQKMREWFESKSPRSSTSSRSSKLQAAPAPPSSVVKNGSSVEKKKKYSSRLTVSSQPSVALTASEESVKVCASFDNNQTPNKRRVEVQRERSEITALQEDHDDPDILHQAAYDNKKRKKISACEELLLTECRTGESSKPDTIHLQGCEHETLGFNPSEMSDSNYSTLVDFVMNDLAHGILAPERKLTSETSPSCNDSFDHTISSNSTMTTKSKYSLLSKVKGIRKSKALKSPPVTLRKMKKKFTAKRGASLETAEC